MRRVALPMLALAACAGPAEHPRAVIAVAPTAVADPPTAPPAVAIHSTEDIVIAGARRLEELRAELPPEADEATAARATGWIAAFGTCRRPDEAEQAALSRVIRAWELRAVPGTTRAEGALESLRYGCVEAGGIVVDAQVDLTFARRGGAYRTGRWWTLRVAGTKVRVLAEASGCAIDDCMEWSNIARVETLVLADLDRDGALDPVVVRDQHEGGAPGEYDVEVAGQRLGHQRDSLTLAPLQPPPADGVVVLALDDGDGPRYRCVTAGATAWSVCPAAERMTRYTAAIAAADDLISHAPEVLMDRDRLAADLARLGNPPETAALLAAAEPSTLDKIIAGVVRDQDAALAALTAGEREAAITQAQAALTSGLRDALGDTRCPPGTPAQERAARVAIDRWIERHDTDGTPAAVRSSCVGDAGAYWFVEWKNGWPREPRHRVGLFFLAGGKVTRLADSTSAFEYGESGDAAYAAGPDLEVKLARHGATITALAGLDDQAAVAIVDGKVTGTRAEATDLIWTAFGPGGEMAMRDDALALGYDPELEETAFYRAGPAGFEVVASFTSTPPTEPLTATTPAAALLETNWRARVADAWLRSRPALPATRADLLAALTIAGASPALVAHATAAALPKTP